MPLYSCLRFPSEQLPIHLVHHSHLNHRRQSQTLTPHSAHRIVDKQSILPLGTSSVSLSSYHRCITLTRIHLSPDSLVAALTACHSVKQDYISAQIKKPTPPPPSCLFRIPNHSLPTFTKSSKRLPPALQPTGPAITPPFDKGTVQTHNGS